MKVLKVALKIDSFVQGLLLLGFLINAINGLIQYKSFYFIVGHLYLLSILGVWQVSSGLILALKVKDENRAKYLLLVLYYFLFWVVIYAISMMFDYLPFLTGQVRETLGQALICIYGFCVPVLIGTYYFSITYKNMIRSHYFKRSFWDI